MTADQPILKSVDLSIGYRDRKTQDREVARNLNLKLHRGRFVCLLGPNGTGKSTLIRTLGGLQANLDGEIYLQGNAMASLTPQSRAKQISLVLTGNLPMGIFSVYSMVALGRHPHTRWNGSLTNNDQVKIDWAIRTVKAESLTERHLGELSDGERQKVMIARALAQEALVMLLDEPTAFLDVVRRMELMHTLRDLAHEQNLAILLSTHDLELALQNSDELWLLSEDGHIITGAPEALALSGKLGGIFESQEMKWDSDHGSFRMKREPCLSASLTGNGPELLWTRRAMSRLGYGISDSESASLSIHITKMGSETQWKVTTERGIDSFNSLEHFTSWLEQLNSQ